MSAITGFALCPDGGPNRVIRFVDNLPVTSMVASLDPGTNVLLISRELFTMLTKEQQARVMKTRSRFVEAHTLEGMSLSLA